MKVSKLDLLAIAAVAGVLALIEHGHRITIEAPTLADASAQASPSCPANESVPFSAECMAFIQDGARSTDLRRVNLIGNTYPDSPELPK
jgi:hypothetical protein